jgi:hypothetical protein
MGAHVNGKKRVEVLVDLETTGKTYIGSKTPILPERLQDGDAWVDGRVWNGKGVISQAADWGVSLYTIPSTGFGTPRTGTCTFDYTGGAYENLLTVSGITLAASDVGKTVIIQDGVHNGSVAIIEEFIDASNARLETCGWDDDLAAGTGVVLYDDYHSFTSPQLKINNIGQTCEWENVAHGHTGRYATKLYTTSSGSNVTNLRLDFVANGYTNNDSLTMRHTVGNLASGDIQKVVRVTVDDSECEGGSGAEIDGIKFVRAQGGSTANVKAINVGTSFSKAFQVEASPPVDPDYGYSVTSGYVTATDHVNSSGGGNDAFKSAATNIQLFPTRYASVLIGSDTVFSIVEFVASVVASATITPVFEYSTGDGTWSALPVSDTTNGFRATGKISFTPPSAWAKSAHAGNAGGGAAITEAYYIRITRNAVSVATPPTESYFKVYDNGTILPMSINGDGTVSPAWLADASAPIDTIYFSTTGSKLSYKTSGGVVQALY